MDTIDTDTYLMKLPDPLKDQLKWLYTQCHDDPKINRLKYKIHEKYGGSKEAAGFIAILKYFPANYFLSEKWIFRITGYAKDGQQVHLRKEIKCGKHVRVYRAKLGSRDVIAKWYNSHRHDTSYEIEIYRELASRGCPLPWFSDKFLFWQTPLLVMEELDPLDAKDDPYQVGIAILIQLQYLHQFAVHSGIKPDNIMKRYRSSTDLSYFLIDFGGTTTERLGYGYRRWLHSPEWTSQNRHVKNQITTPKNDFLELGFTMKSLSHWKSSGPDVHRARTDFTGRLKRYMKAVSDMSPRDSFKEENYEKLIRILSE